ncbi:MAG: NAD(P)H-quinone oxidoreductase [Myxococcota bacterium]
MRAIEIVGEAREARLVLREHPAPRPGPGELRVDVVATAVNRADLLQRRGLYPPPPGASPILGLECAGVIEELGPGVRGFQRGERVMALLPGGGYAEQAVVHAGSVMRIPASLSFIEGAAVPEVFLTCHLNLFMLGRLEKGQRALVHGGGSGIGTTAIQLLRCAGARSIVTCGGAEKCARCLELGADAALNYREEKLAERILEASGGAGVDLALDSIGAPYLALHLRCLRPGGRLILIGLMGGVRAEINLGVLLARRLELIGSTLRARSAEDKAEIVRSFEARFGDELARRRIVPVIDRELPLDRAQEAHEVLERSEHFGKLVLRVREDPGGTDQKPSVASS